MQGAKKALKKITVLKAFNSGKEQYLCWIALYFFFIKLAAVTLQGYTSVKERQKEKASNNVIGKGQVSLLKSNKSFYLHKT